MHLVGITIDTYYDAQTYECQKWKSHYKAVEALNHAHSNISQNEQFIKYRVKDPPPGSLDTSVKMIWLELRYVRGKGVFCVGHTLNGAHNLRV